MSAIIKGIIMSSNTEAGEVPQVGDEWEFRLPHMKAKRVKIVGSISEREFIIERATNYPWKHKTAMLPYINWARQNKGRYTGVTVRRLMEFGRRVSTQAEREAKYAGIAEKRKRERAEREANQRRIDERFVPCSQQGK